MRWWEGMFACSSGELTLGSEIEIAAYTECKKIDAKVS